MHQKICQGQLLESYQQICDGAILSDDKKIFYGCLNNTEKCYAIPEGVTCIAFAALEGKRFHSIILPKSIEIIDRYAFANCVGLTKIVIPKNVKIIREGAFWGCTNLKKIIVKGRKPWREDYLLFDDVKIVEIEIGARKKREQSLTYQPFLEVSKLLENK